VAFLELYLQVVKRGFRVPQLINSVQAGGVAYRRLKPLLAPALSVEGNHHARRSSPATWPDSSSNRPRPSRPDRVDP